MIFKISLCYLVIYLNYSLTFDTGRSKPTRHKSYLQLSSSEVSKYDLLNEFLALKIYQYSGIYILNLLYLILNNN
jgi:hypothetical protein